MGLLADNAGRRAVSRQLLPEVVDTHLRPREGAKVGALPPLLGRIDLHPLVAVLYEAGRSFAVAVVRPREERRAHRKLGPLWASPVARVPDMPRLAVAVDLRPECCLLRSARESRHHQLAGEDFVVVW